MTRAAPARPRPGVWLHAGDPASLPGLSVLAAHLAEQPEAPRTRLTGGPQAPGPGDDPRAIEAAIDAFGARVLVLAGGVLPVPLIERARARGVALVLVDAVNPVPSAGWRILPGYARGVLSQFQQIHARDTAAAAAISRTVKGAVPVLVTGALARHAPVRGCNAPELDALRQALGARPVWFAHALPESESDAVFLAHAHALRRAPRLLLIVQPADPGLGAGMAARAADVGFVRARRSQDEDIAETSQVYLADTEDDPGLFLRLAPVTYLGGSLSPQAATPSPVSAAALGSALVFGPQASAGDRVFLDALRRLGGGRQIGTAADLGEAISTLLSPEAGAEAALRAWTLATEGSEATHTVARAICDWLDLNAGGPS
ncbi:MAG: hypothetical protein H6900_01105 [Rhodobacter sp.]|uniref:3-deoxy-D-manno-octulosonic acid transferase n=1 Tax=Pararhodobacter sp. TaxID=2127056 RepID=UPI001D20FA85|nr:glycosyltransferase N-terminal domain-containing protein [Pararhodobacter sp.]MCB1344653.1 hypothetical protein [Paracoccaceae bacterium]MCC0071863.1 hypothetical protein [Rhodobacter sp.]HPD92590.1 glycosyltransferase N-terminal domain-containing protein [Pararhodobacter sp.]